MLNNKLITGAYLNNLYLTNLPDILIINISKSHAPNQSLCQSIHLIFKSSMSNVKRNYILYYVLVVSLSRPGQLTLSFLPSTSRLS